MFIECFIIATVCADSVNKGRSAVRQTGFSTDCCEAEWNAAHETLVKSLESVSIAFLYMIKPKMFLINMLLETAPGKGYNC